MHATGCLLRRPAAAIQHVNGSRHNSSRLCRPHTTFFKATSPGSGSGAQPDNKPQPVSKADQPGGVLNPDSVQHAAAAASGQGDTESQAPPAPQQPSVQAVEPQPQVATAADGDVATSQPLGQDATSQSEAPSGSVPATPSDGATGSTASLGGMQTSTGAGAAAAVGAGGVSGGPSAVTLLSQFNGVGYTFVLAGFLKIVTVGGLSLSAPTDVARTAFGKATPYLMLPVGLGLCWIAKQVVDTGLNESKRFLQYLVPALLVLYFGLVKVMYKYDAPVDTVRRPRPRMPGQMAELRAQLGDRELLAAGDMDSSRFYQAEKPGSRELYDDVAWYEGRYPSQLAAPGQQQMRGAARGAALAVTDTEEEYSVAANYNNAGKPRLASGAAAEPVKAPARRSFLSDSTR